MAPSPFSPHRFRQPTSSPGRRQPQQQQQGAGACARTAADRGDTVMCRQGGRSVVVKRTQKWVDGCPSPPGASTAHLMPLHPDGISGTRALSWHLCAMMMIICVRARSTPQCRFPAFVDEFNTASVLLLFARVWPQVQVHPSTPSAHRTHPLPRHPPGAAQLYFSLDVSAGLDESSHYF